MSNSKMVTGMDLVRALAHCRMGGQRWMTLTTPGRRMAGMLAREMGLAWMQVGDNHANDEVPGNFGNVMAKLTDKGMLAMSYTEASKIDDNPSLDLLLVAEIEKWIETLAKLTDTPKPE